MESNILDLVWIGIVACFFLVLLMGIKALYLEYIKSEHIKTKKEQNESDKNYYSKKREEYKKENINTDDLLKENENLKKEIKQKYKIMGYTYPELYKTLDEKLSEIENKLKGV